MNFKNSKFVYGTLFLTSILLSACGGGGGSATTPTTNSTTASDALFLDAANPVNVIVTADTTRAASQVVTTAGATLNATDANNNQFALVIPASAVTQTTTITMTPIASMAGLPFAGGLVAGVQFLPDGLFLEKEATLTIVPATAVPVGNQTFVGYLGNGNDLHLVPPAAPTVAIQMRVGHFSGMGLASGTSAERATQYLKRAADHEVRLGQELAKDLGDQRRRELVGAGDETSTGGPTSSDYFASFYGLVVRPRVLVAGASCANATLARQTYLSFERKLQVLGSTNTYDTNNADWNTITNAINAKCNALANRYSGLFTEEQPSVMGIASASGTVTFVRDDAACVAASGLAADTACYRVEEVTYTSTAPPPPGCTVAPVSHTVTLFNTSVLDSYLKINLTGDPAGLHQYMLIASWNKLIPGVSTLTCDPLIVPGLDADPSAGLASNPGGSFTGGQTVQGGYTNINGGNYTWSLNAAP